MRGDDAKGQRGLDGAPGAPGLKGETGEPGKVPGGSEFKDMRGDEGMKDLSFFLLLDVLDMVIMWSFLPVTIIE